MTIMDFGTANGKPNIQLVRSAVNPEVYAYLPGLRDPFTAGGLNSPKIMASPVDGYEIHKADWMGVLVNNPMRLGEWIPEILD